MFHHVLNFSSRFFVLLLAASPLFFFQNCAQNFDLASVGDVNSLGDQFMQPSSFVLDRGTGYSSRLLLPVHLTSPDAREVLITQSRDCQPAAGEGWQPMAATQVYPLPQRDRAYRLYVKFRTLPGDLGKAVSLETSCVGADIVHDGKPPVVSVLSPQPAATAGTAVPVDIDARDNHELERLQCTLFNAGLLAGKVIDCAAKFTLASLALGENRLEVLAIDRAGNESTVETYKVFVDQVKPTVAILTPASGASLATPSVNFTFTVDDNYLPGSAQRECRVDSGASVVQNWVRCSSAGQHTSPALTNGNYRFSVRAIDTVGNVSETAYRDFTVNAVAGAFVVAGLKDKGGGDTTVDEWLAGDRKPQVVWGASAGAVRYEVSIHDAGGGTVCAVQNVSSPALNFAFDCELTDGNVYGAKVVAYSATGQPTPAPLFTFTVDVTGTPASLASFSLSHAKVELRAQADGPVTEFQCLHRFTPENGAPYNLGTTDCRGTVLFQGGDHRAGRHEIRVVTKDPAGNSRTTLVKSYTVHATDCAKIPGALTSCPLVHDRFNREFTGPELTGTHDLVPWLKHLDTALGSSVDYGGIFRAAQFGAWPAASSAEGLILAGVAGKDILLITKPYDLSGYARRVVKFDYATLSLGAGEDVRVEYCAGTAQECGVYGAGDGAALTDGARWKNLATLAKSADPNLTGVGVGAEQWLVAEHELPAVGGETYVRLRYQFSEGFAANRQTLLDGVMIDNFKILVDR